MFGVIWRGRGRRKQKIGEAAVGQTQKGWQRGWRENSSEGKKKWWCGGQMGSRWGGEGIADCRGRSQRGERSLISNEP